MSEARKQEPYETPADEPVTADGAGLDAGGSGSLADAEAAIAALEAECAELRDRMMRALADAENARKRAERDRREGMLYGGARLARDILPVYDHLSRALEAADDATRANASGLYEGIDLTLRELVNVLSRHGVERILPQPGDAFDPHLHQAMFEAPVPDTPAGQVIQVMGAGFRIHDQLLRPAHVGVSAAPPA